MSLARLRYPLYVAAAFASAVTFWAAMDGSQAPRAHMHAGPISIAPPEVETAPPEKAIGSTPPGGLALSGESLSAALADSEPGKRDLVLGGMLPSLVAHDAPAAARFAELLADPYERELSLRVVAQHWARHDADAALAWAGSLGEPRERDAAVGDVALGLARDDPGRALQLRESFAGVGTHDATLVALAEQWALRDFNAAVAWSRQQPDTRQREAIFTRLTFVRAENGEHEAAALFAAETLNDPRAREDALAMVAAHWAYRDLPAARAWARGLEGSARERAELEIATFAADVAR